MIDTSLITQLRGQTGAGIVDCKDALTQSNGDIAKAIEILRKKGLKTVEKKMAREAKEGVIISYVHSNKKIGVLVELVCETDFVARNDEFQELAKDIAMHAAAMNPRYLRPEDVPTDVLEKEKEIYREQLKKEGKPEKMFEQILQGKLQKFYEDHCLLKQAFVKDDKRKIEDLVNEKVAKIGEKIELRRFVRYELGL